MDGTAYVWDGVREEVVRVRDSASMYRVKSDGDSVTVSELSARTLT